MARPRLATCKRGHDMNVTRRIINGRSAGCGECHREQNRHGPRALTRAELLERIRVLEEEKGRTTG